MENLLISACLLGTPCRYDGASKKYEGVEALSEKYNLIPVCPEVLGGLPTPRTPSERIGDRVVMKDGRDVTKNYFDGAKEALKTAKRFGCKKALFKARSPSCSPAMIYDGSFSGTLVKGEGVAAELLRREGITVYSEEELEKLL